MKSKKFFKKKKKKIKINMKKIIFLKIYIKLVIQKKLKKKKYIKITYKSFSKKI